MPDENLTPAPGPIPHPGPPLPLPPPHLLDISRSDGTPWTNPPYDTSNPNWSSNVVGGQTFSGSAPNIYEWVSVLNPMEEQDDEVGLSGTVVNPGMASTDFYFTHPFGGDFEFTIVPDSAYTNLLATSNKDPNGRYKDDWSAAQSAGIAVPTGLLGVEIDGALVPPEFMPMQGDSVAVYGRWIVDAGHKEFHTEIHPPLLMAHARAVVDSGNTVPQSENVTTQFWLWSRPYQARQQFITNNTQYAFRDYCVQIAETIKAVRAYPSFLPYQGPPQPFQGVHSVAFTVRPAPAPDPTWQLLASYHFTINDSCLVQVKPSPADPNSLLVIVTLDSYAYPALPNPPDHFVTYNTQDLLKQAGIDLSNLGWFDQVIADALLPDQVEIDRFDAPQTSLTQDNVNVIPMTPIATLPEGGIGKVIDNNQPFPVYGWVQLRWFPPAPNPS